MALVSVLRASRGHDGDVQDKWEVMWKAMAKQNSLDKQLLITWPNSPRVYRTNSMSAYFLVSPVRNISVGLRDLLIRIIWKECWLYFLARSLEWDQTSFLPYGSFYSNDRARYRNNHPQSRMYEMWKDLGVPREDGSSPKWWPSHAPRGTWLASVVYTLVAV